MDITKNNYLKWSEELITVGKDEVADKLRNKFESYGTQRINIWQTPGKELEAIEEMLKALDMPMEEIHLEDLD